MATPRCPDCLPELGGDRADRFETLALRHLGAVHNLARKLTGTVADAEDVVQDVYLRAFRYFGTCQGDDCRNWLLAITRRCFLAWAARNRDRRLVLGLEQADCATIREALWTEPQASPEALAMQRGDAAILARLVGSLPAEYREVLLLREFDGMAYAAIAQAIGVPIGTVMSRLARARALIRQRWHDEAARPDSIGRAVC